MLDKIQAWLDQREPREKKLMLLMFLTFFVLGTFLAVSLFSKGFAKRQEETQQLREAIAHLYQNKSSHLANLAEKKAMKEHLDEQFKNSSLNAKSLLGKMGSDYNIDVQARDTSQARSSGEIDGREIVEKEIQMDLKNVEHADLMPFLATIEASEHLLYIKKITIEKVRRRGKKGQNDLDTPLRTNLTIGTFTYKTDQDDE